MAATTQTPSYEKWCQVDPTQKRVHIVGHGDYEHNEELRTHFSKYFGAPVKAVYSHVLGTAKVFQGTTELYREGVFIFPLSGGILKIQSLAETHFTHSTDKEF